MEKLNEQIATLRQQNEQILSALHSLQSEFRAFRAEVLGSSDYYHHLVHSWASVRTA